MVGVLGELRPPLIGSLGMLHASLPRTPHSGPGDVNTEEFRPLQHFVTVEKEWLPEGPRDLEMGNWTLGCFL